MKSYDVKVNYTFDKVYHVVAYSKEDAENIVAEYKTKILDTGISAGIGDVESIAYAYNIPIDEINEKGIFAASAKLVKEDYTQDPEALTRQTIVETDWYGIGYQVDCAYMCLTTGTDPRDIPDQKEY